MANNLEIPTNQYFYLPAYKMQLKRTNVSKYYTAI